MERKSPGFSGEGRNAMYFAIIGDIIDSRSLKQRDAVQEKLEAVLKETSQRFHQQLASDFTITLGDEFQGLFQEGRGVLEAVDLIRIRMAPVDIRFGIGVGTMATRIHREKSLGADGPAYWNAREALKAIHKDNDYGRARVQLKAPGATSLERLINENLRLMDYMESRWRDSQRDLVHHSIQHYGYDLSVKQTTLAETLSISTQALNQRVKSSGYYNYLRTRRTLESILQREWGGAS